MSLLLTSGEPPQLSHQTSLQLVSRDFHIKHHCICHSCDCRFTHHCILLDILTSSSSTYQHHYHTTPTTIKHQCFAVAVRFNFP
eukprot:m.18461 g.18461  ORF g.18461 m.18461 type:complete len:84 (+) comp12035_c0_seq1:1040-1291(+)